MNSIIENMKSSVNKLMQCFRLCTDECVIFINKNDIFTLTIKNNLSLNQKK